MEEEGGEEGGEEDLFKAILVMNEVDAGALPRGRGGSREGSIKELLRSEISLLVVVVVGGDN